MVLTWEGSLYEARFYFAPPYDTFSAKSRNQVFFMDPTAGTVHPFFYIICTYVVNFLSECNEKERRIFLNKLHRKCPKWVLEQFDTGRISLKF